MKAHPVGTVKAQKDSQHDIGVGGDTTPLVHKNGKSALLFQPVRQTIITIFDFTGIRQPTVCGARNPAGGWPRRHR